MKKSKLCFCVGLFLAILISVLIYSILILSRDDEDSYFKGKRILILGDSISDTKLYPKCWVNSFSTDLKGVAQSVTNISMQGRTYTRHDGDKGNTLLDSLPDITEKYDDIIVFMGVNDYFNQVPFGFFDSNTESELNGAFNAFNDWIVNNQPQAKVHIVTPLKNGRTDIIVYSNPANLSMYVDCICTNAMYYGWQIIDAHAYAPVINPFSRSDLYLDTTHPTEEYAEMLANFIENSVASGTSAHSEIPTYLDLTQDSTAFAFLDESGECTITFHEYNVTGSGNVKVMDIPEALIPEHQVTGVVYAVNSEGVYKGYPVTNIENEIYVLFGNDTIDGVINGQLGSYVFRHNSPIPLLSM